MTKKQKSDKEAPKEEQGNQAPDTSAEIDQMKAELEAEKNRVKEQIKAEQDALREEAKKQKEALKAEMAEAREKAREEKKAEREKLNAEKKAQREKEKEEKKLEREKEREEKRLAKEKESIEKARKREEEKLERFRENMKINCSVGQAVSFLPYKSKDESERVYGTVVNFGTFRNDYPSYIIKGVDGKRYTKSWSALRLEDSLPETSNDSPAPESE